MYILQSQKNNRYYVGSTNDVRRRLKEHNNGQQQSTRYLVPWKLVYVKQCDELIEARKLERKIKSWKSRKEIEKLINMGL